VPCLETSIIAALVFFGAFWSNISSLTNARSIVSSVPGAYHCETLAGGVPAIFMVVYALAFDSPLTQVASARSMHVLSL